MKTSVALNKVMSVAELFESAFRQVPGKEFIYDGARRLTYRDIQTEALEIAAALQHLGVKKGARVAVCLPTWYEFFVLFYAITKIGAILVPLNPRYRMDELAYILDHSRPEAAFIAAGPDNAPQIEQFVSIQEKQPVPFALISVRFEDERMPSYERMREIGRTRSVADVPIDPKEDVAAFIYTSGTTGKPKAAMLTHRNIVSRGLIFSRPTLENEVFLHAATPYNHVMGISSIADVLACKGKAVLMDTYKPELALQWTEREKVTSRFGVPTHFILEMNHPSFKNYDLSSVNSVLMAAMNIPPEVFRRVRTEYGCHVQTAYGMTEICALGTQTRIDDDEIIQSETVGKPEEGVEIKIVDESRRPVATGVIGEIAIRSPGLMKGYYNAPEQTNEVIDEEGWYYTGDLGALDENGYLRIAGRKKEMIIRGGYKIYPAEVENLFYSHPSILEVAVVGLPDTVLGEVSCAAVQLKPGFEETPETLKAYARDHLADYKTPDHILFIDEYPKTSSGKIQKHLLRERIIRENLCPLR